MSNQKQTTVGFLTKERGQHRAANKDHRYNGEITKSLDKHQKTGGRVRVNDVYSALEEENDFSDLPPMFPDEDQE